MVNKVFRVMWFTCRIFAGSQINPWFSCLLSLSPPEDSMLISISYQNHIDPHIDPMWISGTVDTRLVWYQHWHLSSITILVFTYQKLWFLYCNCIILSCFSWVRGLLWLGQYIIRGVDNDEIMSTLRGYPELKWNLYFRFQFGYHFQWRTHFGVKNHIELLLKQI